MTSGNDDSQCSVIGCDQRTMVMMSFVSMKDYLDERALFGKTPPHDEYPLCHPHYRFLKAFVEVVTSGQGMIDVRPEEGRVTIKP